MIGARTWPGSRPRLVLLFLLLAGLSLARPGAASAASSPAAVTAVGDVHGDFDAFSALLQHSGLIDAQLQWTGGHAILVQTGDLLDRGPKPREAMDLMMSLQKEAGKKGGRVVALLGNHEVMNIMGDLRYVTAQNYASYAGKNSEKLQQSAYRQYTDWRKDHQALLTSIAQAFPETSEAEWMSRIRPGLSSSARPSAPTANTASGCGNGRRSPKWTTLFFS